MCLKNQNISENKLFAALFFLSYCVVRIKS